MSLRRTLLMSVAVLTGGCGGEYLLTAPDVAALPGETAPVVVRLQRREFWRYWPAVEDATIAFRSEDGLVRCARTDDDGYAVVGFPAPDGLAVKRVGLHHQDNLGYTVTGQVHIYTLSPDRPVAAVDVDSFPSGGKEAACAAAALGRIMQETQIIYLTQDCAAAPERAHRILAKAGCPPGPVIPWRVKPPWYARNPFRRRSGGSLEAMRQRLPKLRWGIAADAASAERLNQAGLKVLVVGKTSARIEDAEYFASWRDLRLGRPTGPPQTSQPRPRPDK